MSLDRPLYEASGNRGQYRGGGGISPRDRGRNRGEPAAGKVERSGDSAA